jgi:hypothetical protein
MGLQTASQYSTIAANTDSIINNPELSFSQKAADLGRIYMELNSPDPSHEEGFLRGVLRTAAGVGLGIGLAQAFKSEILGGDMDKTASDREAFRYGFLKAACEKGYFSKVAFNPLALITDPIMGVSSATRGVGESAGAAAGAFDAPGEADEKLTRTMVETELLKQEQKRLEAERRNALLKKILAKRSH